jgi:hypothetical protein
MIAEQKSSLIMPVLLFVMVFVYHLGHGFYYARGGAVGLHPLLAYLGVVVSAWILAAVVYMFLSN